MLSRITFRIEWLLIVVLVVVLVWFYLDNQQTINHSKKQLERIRFERDSISLLVDQTAIQIIHERDSIRELIKLDNEIFENYERLLSAERAFGDSVAALVRGGGFDNDDRIRFIRSRHNRLFADTVR